MPASTTAVVPWAAIGRLTVAPSRLAWRRWQAISRSRSRSSAAAIPACRPPTTWRASTGSGPWCWRPGGSAGGPRAAMAASAGRAGPRSATARWSGAGASPRRGGSSMRRTRAVASCAAWPRTRASISRSPASASIGWRTGRAAGPSSRTRRRRPSALFGERWELWRKAELEERLLRSPEAHGCLVMPHYFGFNPMRYVRGLAAAAATRGAMVHPETPVTAWQRRAGGTGW